MIVLLFLFRNEKVIDNCILGGCHDACSNRDAEFSIQFWRGCFLRHPFSSRSICSKVLFFKVDRMQQIGQDKMLDMRFPTGPQPITFLSERHPVTLMESEIKYVESNGSEFKNKTPISQWESILGKDFVRIHRSFIVNVNYITSIDKDAVFIESLQLPVSRKYKANINTFK